MMCGLSFEKEREAETKWLLIEKGLERLPQIQSQLDTFQNAGYELRWLSEGFPLYDDSASVASNNLYWRLVEQLQTEKADDMIVISRNSINNFEGKRPELPANIRWMSVPVDAADFTLKAATDGDSVVVREGHSDADKTYFTTQRFLSKEWVSPNKPDTMAPIEIALVADDFYRNDQRIVEASLRALRSLGPIHVTKLKDIDSSTPVKYMHAVLDLFKPRVHIVHISSNPSALSAESNAEKQKLEKVFSNYNPQFYAIKDNDVVNTLDQFAIDNNMDLIITLRRKHGLNGLLQTSHTKRLAYHTHVPLVAIHE
jgi:nucleotide-binding universal stress UspA family protein